MNTTTPAPRRASRPRLSRAEQKTERIQQLLDAAWVKFCEKGYEKLTIDDVAEHAGYSRMPVYSLFGDKQNLFFELWRSMIEQLTATFIGGFKPGIPLKRNLEALARTVADGDGPDKPPHGESLFFVVQTIALSRPDLLAKLHELSLKVVTEFAEAVRVSTLGPGEKLRNDVETIAAHLVAHINGMSTVQFQTGQRYNTRYRDLVDIFTTIAFKSSPNG